MQSIRKSAAFSLVELMVALALGLLLTAGLLQLFSGTKQTYTANESLARVQENIRFSMDLVQGDVRGAMSFGFCAARPVVHSHLNLTADWQQALFSANSEVMGWEYANTAPGDDPYDLDADFPGGAPGDWETRIELTSGSIGSFDLPGLFSQSSSVYPVAGSDVLVVRRSRPIPHLTSDGTSFDLTAATINLDGNHDLHNRLVLVTDCNSADLFRNVSSNASELSRAAEGACGQCPGNQSGGQWRTQILSPTVQVYEMQIIAYFVGFNEERGEPGLYRLDVSGCPCGSQPEEMVDGVENMQLVFGVSPSSRIGGTFVNDDNWLPANQVIDEGWWWQVIGARVGLLQRSQESAGTERFQQEFDLVGTSIRNASDARMRQDGVTTLSFRNRVVTDSGVSDG